MNFKRERKWQTNQTAIQKPEGKEWGENRKYYEPGEILK